MTAPAQLLHDAQPRLAAALATLRAAPASTEIDALADRVGAFFAGEPVDAGRAWLAAQTLLHLHEQPARAPKQRLVVYTVLVGAKESLANPLASLPHGATSDLDLDFVCITDNPALRSEAWRIVTMPGGHLAPEKLSRRPKALPHDYFPDAEYSLYIDNTVSFKRLPQASDLLTKRRYLFKAFRHATRSNPEQEAAAVAMLGYDDAETICRQLAFYAARGPLAEITPLTTATVLLRQHHAPAVRRFGTTWWESVLAFSKRDQLSFDFARRLADCEVEYFEGATHANDWLSWQGSLAQHRVKASFDDRRYAWLHRDDPAARADPRGHFLRHHEGSDAAYQRPSALLEVACQMHGSSLGGQVSPRRSVAGALEALLAPHRSAGRRWLLLRVEGAGAQPFERAELDAAARALQVWLHPAAGTLIDLGAAELDDGRVYGSAGGSFDAVVVLGADGPRLPAALRKVEQLLGPHGSLAAVLSEPLPLATAAEIETRLAARLGRRPQAALAGSRHDALAAALPNSLLTLGW